MATHSSVLAWRIPQMEEPGRLWSIGSQRVDTTEASEHTCALQTKSRQQLSVLKRKPSGSNQRAGWHGFARDCLSAEARHVLMSDMQSDFTTGPSRVFPPRCTTDPTSHLCSGSPSMTPQTETPLSKSSSLRLHPQPTLCKNSSRQRILCTSNSYIVRLYLINSRLVSLANF